MGFPRQNATQVMSVIRQIASHPQLDENQRLVELFNLVPQYLAMAIGNTLAATRGSVVLGGLFEGMRLPERTETVASPPHLLGTYELELQPHFARLGSRSYDVLVNVGCAEGYYAAGLGRLWNVPEIHAFDIDTRLHKDCRAFLEANGLADRLTLGAAFEPAYLERFAGRRVFVLCDIEGAEFGMIDGRRHPVLTRADIVIELHPGGGHTVESLTETFAVTHDVTVVRPMHRPLDPPAALDGMTEIQKLVALCEFRGAENPWAVMVRREWP